MLLLFVDPHCTNFFIQRESSFEMIFSTGRMQYERHYTRIFRQN